MLPEPPLLTVVVPTQPRHSVGGSTVPLEPLPEEPLPETVEVEVLELPVSSSTAVELLEAISEVTAEA